MWGNTIIASDTPPGCYMSLPGDKTSKTNLAVCRALGPCAARPVATAPVTAAAPLQSDTPASSDLGDIFDFLHSPATSSEVKTPSATPPADALADKFAYVFKAGVDSSRGSGHSGSTSAVVADMLSRHKAANSNVPSRAELSDDVIMALIRREELLGEADIWALEFNLIHLNDDLKNMLRNLKQVIGVIQLYRYCMQHDVCYAHEMSDNLLLIHFISNAFLVYFYMAGQCGSRLARMCIKITC